jgi:Icc protein
MKIIQITDLHIAGEGVNTNGVDVHQNFLDVLKAAKSLSPDLIVLSGDLCFDTADEGVYQWIKSHLDFIKVPYTVIGGNHDNSELMARVFNLEHLLITEELYYKRILGHHYLLFLETSSGVVSEEQLAWLEYELSRQENDTVVFMHHPPLVAGVPHMDVNYPLRNMEAVQEVFFNFRHHLSVFCGHYHVEKTLCVKNLTVHITPSTYFQMDWHSEKFKVDHFRIALREINLRQDGIVSSTVVYFDGNKT